MTLVSYERDIQQVTGVLMTLKNRENNRAEEIGFVTPNSGCSGNNRYPANVCHDRQTAFVTTHTAKVVLFVRMISCHLY